MAESTRRDSEDGASCAREQPARDEQPLPATQSRSVPCSQYKYDLVNPPVDEAICPVCLDLAIKPFIVECCGQHFCQQCLANVRAKGNVCPLCRENAPSALHDKYFERNIIHKQQVKCTEKKNGCQWIGLLGELQRHLTQCQFVENDCPYKCGDRVQRRHLEEHKANLCPQRPFVCGHCDHDGTYREVTGQHWAECEKFPLPCPNKCGADKIPRGQLQGHRDTECPLQEVACEFSHAGCKVQVVRQDLSQHMSDAAQQHMALVSRALLQDKERETAELKQQLREEKQELAKKEGQHKVEMAKIDKQHKEEMEKKDEQHKEEMKQKDKQYKEEVEKKDKQHKEELEKKDMQYKEEMEKKVKQLKEEMEKKDKQHKEVVERMCGLEDMIRDHMERTSKIQCVLGANDYTFVFTDYEEKKGKLARWYSPPYYTHSHGYKMCVELCASTIINKLVAYSHLLPGEYDAGLKWPFRGTVVVQLLNQLSDDNHHDFVFDYLQASDEESQRKTDVTTSVGLAPRKGFLLLADLMYDSSKKRQYLRNNCLTFKVVVKNL